MDSKGKETVNEPQKLKARKTIGNLDIYMEIFISV